MHVERTSGAAAFVEQARPLLERDEARHNLAFGILATAQAHPGVYPEVHGWLVRDKGVVGAALRTPPYNLIVVQPSDGRAAGPLAAAIEEELPGVVGAVPEVDAFAAAWAGRRAVELDVRFEQRIYRLQQVVPPPAVAGRLRLATMADRELVSERFLAFGHGVSHGPDDPARDGRLARAVDARLASPEAGVGLWEVDGEIVSLAGFGGPTPNGLRVGPVHTPRPLRGRGYGTAVTAAVSALLLERGHRFCFLYTDLANPTSNAIYTRIGYEPVCDSREIAFVPKAPVR